MPTLKCKMCGGDLIIAEGSTICECEYCGTKQTVPSADNEKKVNLFNRANHLRSSCEFDKAAGVYESIVSEFPEEAEAYWGLCLCKFGIEYVDDPATGKKIPTCHRTSYESIFEDSNFEQALEWADSVANSVYRTEAKEIDRLQKEILDIARNEEPFDVFICYKETDDLGQRTVDSELAHDIYDVLTEKGYKVFYARITLKAKLGQDYEPYIFSALNSAKVMLAIGTKYEYYNAVWVKNEWSRFLALMNSENGKTLIPCYRDIDAYDIPKEFKHLQGQDLSSPRAFQDLVNNIEKIIPRVTQQVAPVTNIVTNTVVNSGAASLVKRGYLALEDGDWANADKFFEESLNVDAECAQAYVGKYLVQNKFNSLGDILKIAQKVDNETTFVEKRLGDTERKYEIAAKYEEIVSRDIIGSIFEKHLTYSTRTEKLKSRIAKEKSNFEQDKCLIKALRFADEAYKKQIITAHNQLIKAFDSLIAKAEETDNTGIQSVEAKYKSADDEIKEIYEQKIRKNEQAEHERIEREEKHKIEEYDRACKIQERLSRMILPNSTDGLRHYIEVLNSDYLSAEHIFHSLGNYQDSEQREKECMNSRIQKINLAQNEIKIIKAKNTRNSIIGLIFACIVIVCITIPAFIHNIKQKMLQEKTSLILEALKNDPGSIPTCIDAGYGNTFGIKSDGSVVALGYNESNQCDVSKWTDIVDLCAGGDHTIGLKSDGTVVAVGDNSQNQCDLSEWKDIIDVSAGLFHSVGLKADGTVVAEGDINDGQCNVSSWSDIVAISSGAFHTVGLKSDGTVVAVGYNDDEQCNVSGWSNIVSISAGAYHTVGLKSDGTVVAVGRKEDERCNVSDWNNIISISARGWHTVGLKSDGTVVAVGDKKYGQCNVSDWSDIVAIYAGGSHTVGLKADGTVVAVGSNDFGQCDVYSWRDIKIPNVISD